MTRSTQSHPPNVFSIKKMQWSSGAPKPQLQIKQQVSMTHMEQERRWEDMETDCLVNIFRRLGLDDLTVGVPFVCNSWYKATLDPLCWSTLDFRALDFMPWSDLAKRFTDRYSAPRFSFSGFMRFVVRRSRGSTIDLRFPIVFGSSVEDLDYATNECLSVKFLALPHMMLEDEAHVPELVEKLKNLEQLEMELKPPSFCETVSRIGLNCKRFHGLKMSGAIKEEDVAAIVKFLPNLKCLDLSKSCLPKEQLFSIIDGCRELERLNVKDCICLVADDEVLRRASVIKIFEHEGCRLIDDSCYDTDEECDYVQIF